MELLPSVSQGLSLVLAPGLLHMGLPSLKYLYFHLGCC